jgi:hypothetical protein
MQVPIPLGELELNKKWRQYFKIILPSAILLLTKAYPTMALSDQSNLV